MRLPHSAGSYSTKNSDGKLFDYRVARFNADAESLYMFKGTDRANTLIVERAITALGAFVWIRVSERPGIRQMSGPVSDNPPMW